MSTCGDCYKRGTVDRPRPSPLHRLSQLNSQVPLPLGTAGRTSVGTGCGGPGGLAGGKRSASLTRHGKQASENPWHPRGHGSALALRRRVLGCLWKRPPGVQGVVGRPPGHFLRGVSVFTFTCLGRKATSYWRPSFSARPACRRRGPC